MPNQAKLFCSLGGSPLFIAAVSLLWLPLSVGALAQSAEVSQPASTVAAAVVIPQQVRYAGALSNRAGETVEADFKIYATAEGGEALWTETQRVTVSSDGSYSVVLGAASEKGLPQAVFAGGQARWVGVTIDRAEGVRSPLSSVAYAMKAGDAESVGGLSAANLVTKDELVKLTQTVATAGQAQALVQAQPADSPTGSGMADYVALWTATGNLGDSNLFQASSGFMGIGTTTPGGPLELATGATGGANATMMLEQTSAASGNYYADIGLYNTHGLIGNLSALGAGYTAGNLWGANDIVFLGGQQYAATNVIMMTNTGGALKFGTGGYGKTDERLRIGKTGGISIGNGYVATDPGPGSLIVSGNVGIGTTAPAAVLEVNGTAQFDGLVTFDTGQTFPGTGAGTITGITTSSPLTGSGTSGSVGLGLDTTTLGTTLESTYDTRYAELAGDLLFSDFVEADAADGPGFAGFLGFGTQGSGGIFGSSDKSYGVEGRSYGAQGVLGQAYDPVVASAGVLGYTSSSYSANYSAEAAILYAGVWGDTSSTGSSGVSAGLVGTSDKGYAAVLVNSSNAEPALDVYNRLGLGAVFSSATAGNGLNSNAALGHGVYGSTQGGGDGVYGVNFSPQKDRGGVTGVAGIASTTGGDYKFYGGVWGDSGSDNDAITDQASGVLGTADNARAATFMNNSNDWTTLYVHNNGTGGVGTAVKGGGLFDTLIASSARGTCGIGGGSMSCTGPLKSLASAGGGSRTVETYAMQSPENWMEDFGTGSMVDGKATVNIDPAFAETVAGDTSYKVFITPSGDSKGLYVTARTAKGFEVRESGGGTSSLSFDYRIVAKRLGYEAQRLTDVSEAFARETAEASVADGGPVGMAEPARGPSDVEQALKLPHRIIVPGPAPRKMVSPAKVVPSAKPVSQ